jgi:hypothetical protein
VIRRTRINHEAFICGTHSRDSICRVYVWLTFFRHKTKAVPRAIDEEQAGSDELGLSRSNDLLLSVYVIQKKTAFAT